MIELLRFKYFYIILFSFFVLSILASNKISADQKIKITADEIRIKQDEKIINAIGNAVAQDEKGSKIKSDLIVYDENKSNITANGNIILNDIEGNTYFWSKRIRKNDNNSQTSKKRKR